LPYHRTDAETIVSVIARAIPGAMSMHWKLTVELIFLAPFALL